MAKNKIIYAKTMSYGIMHLVVAFCIAYAVSRNLAVALAISFLEPAVQTCCFFFHEKAWAKVKPV